MNTTSFETAFEQVQTFVEKIERKTLAQVTLNLLHYDEKTKLAS